MPLSADFMGAAIKTAVDEAFAALSPDDKKVPDTVRTAMFKAIASGVIVGLVGQAVVTSTGADPQGGVVSSLGTVTS